MFAAAIFFGGDALADESVTFEADIQPIFVRHCLKCHGPDQQKSSLRLDRRVDLLQGGDYQQPTIVPGKPAESFLLTVVSAQDDLRMPPEGPRLSGEQIDLLRRWIAQGADWPGQMEPVEADPTGGHWSLRPVPAADAVDVNAAAQRIDAMIRHRLERESIQPSPPADPVTLLRRLSFVLTGLPPTPDEVEQFVSHQDRPAAYRQAVDRLLDSPRYGERWAQHWLDVIRWAETVGFETNLERANAWHYRDWVIASLNDDKPYDQFVTEQIAGDTVGQDAALGFLVAGPANLPGQIGRDEEAMRQARQDELDEVIRTVSQALMAMTVGCARCHNHKFDPISQRDYYAMQAIFAGLSYGQRRLRGEQNDRWAEEVPEAQKQLQQAESELRQLAELHDLDPPVQSLQTESFDPVLAKSVRMQIDATGNGAPASLYELQAFTTAEPSDGSTRNVALASSGATPSASSFALANQTRHFENLVDGSGDRRQAFPWVSAKAGAAWVQVDFAQPERIDRIVWDRGSSIPADYRIDVLQADTETWVTVAHTRRRLPRGDDVRGTDKVSLEGLSDQQVAEVVEKNARVRQARAKLNRLSAGPQVYAASFRDAPDPTWLLHRGDPMQKRDVVSPAVPQVLGKMDVGVEDPEKQRRLAFAAHLTDGHHPLTARVIVNRVWQHHFGAGLVETPSDFGKMGAAPVHQELLDWLSADFVAGGWSLKRLHRQIVLSQTFQQSSRPRADALAVDADARLLWRFPPRRLEAEAMRDSILMVSGKLNLEMGGRGFNLFRQRGGLSGYDAIETFEPAGWRRMIYAHKIRMQEVDIFGAFDCPDAGQMKPKRTRSITPTQSLSLFNSPMVMRQAGFFADRVKTVAGPDATAQVRTAFEIALSRSPTDKEQTHLVKLVDQQGLPQLCRVLFNTSEFVYIQ